MKFALLTLLVAGVGFAGCGKKPPAAPPAETQAPASESPDSAAATEFTPSAPVAPVREPARPATATATATVRSVEGPVHPFLTSQLRQFVEEKGRLPENFNEFAGARLDSVPRLPPGLMFVIDPTTQEVKIARKQ